MLTRNLTTSGSVLLLTALFWLLLKRELSRDPHPPPAPKASEVEEEMAGAGTEKLKLFFLAGTLLLLFQLICHCNITHTLIVNDTIILFNMHHIEFSIYACVCTLSLFLRKDTFNVVLAIRLKPPSVLV